MMMVLDVSNDRVAFIFKGKQSKKKVLKWLCPEAVKVKFTLVQAMKAQRGSRGIALLFL
jgi:hypothetical protein